MSSGDDPITAIIAKLVVIEEALVPPVTADKQPHVYDEMPVQPGNFPCFINVPRRGVPISKTSGTRERTEYIDVMLLFGQVNERYSIRAQRLWSPVLQDALDSAIKLDTNVVQLTEIIEWNYDPIEINDVQYVGLTFSLACHLTGAYTFGS